MLPKDERHLLKKIARDSISYGLKYDEAMPVELGVLPPSFTQLSACFVTLYRSGALRGCVGSLQAHRPLAVDVAKNAYSAAFRDCRFKPVDKTVLPELDIHIAILTPANEIACTTEQDLLAQLRPGIDGLIIEDKDHRATFLPAVWESLPNPERFVQELKCKAGLASDYWSAQLHCYRYQVESF
ncbi:AmmeMemoRadiSam system protein A [Methylophaga sp. OBS4]|uniref:AmmeMemoRadiSam system protein A n=1 Tax=Methylophaga sp. OBS4 TaxID=2991935 RepID=UPI00225C1091|nr:AmmeMemoRadiSam system protein A [Methylophaga sp. OBS4]MCX4187055.1 AmmeMemoRadiSam system protein A [Methylophaga sp. OBS4]